MGLLSFLNKKKPGSGSDEPAYQSRAAEESNAMRARGKDGKERKGRGGKAPDDPVLPEKKRARRRLVGAIALVVAVVIGLPMVLDSEPKPLVDDIAIQIPSKDKVQVPQAAPAPLPLPLPMTAPEAPQSAPSIGASLDQKEEVIDPAPSATRAPAADNEKHKPADAVAEPRVAAKAAVKPAATPGPAPAKAEPKPAAAAPTPALAKATSPAVNDEARAKAILDGKADGKPSAAAGKSERVILQIAAMATQEKANEVVNKLKAAGIQTFTQKINTGAGERIRIRLVVANKEEAEKYRERLKKLGFTGSSIAP